MRDCTINEAITGRMLGGRPRIIGNVLFGIASGTLIGTLQAVDEQRNPEKRASKIDITGGK